MQGLTHSGTPGNVYGDCGCAMSNCHGKRCYNAPQSWNLVSVGGLMGSPNGRGCEGRKPSVKRFYNALLTNVPQSMGVLAIVTGAISHHSHVAF